ncbi:MAG: outer membrane protein assembly factor BamD, partial [Pseudomonadota bacterium]
TDWYEDSFKLLTGRGLELEAAGDSWLRKIYRQMIQGRWI